MVSLARSAAHQRQLGRRQDGAGARDVSARHAPRRVLLLGQVRPDDAPRALLRLGADLRQDRGSHPGRTRRVARRVANQPVGSARRSSRAAHGCVACRRSPAVPHRWLGLARARACRHLPAAIAACRISAGAHRRTARAACRPCLTAPAPHVGARSPCPKCRSRTSRRASTRRCCASSACSPRPSRSCCSSTTSRCVCVCVCVCVCAKCS
jgi:hypothetical protein